MSPLTNRDEAKESGFAQVRAALQLFEGDVVTAEFGMWGGKLIDDDGKKIPPKEFLEIECINVKVLETSEELDFQPEDWNFRINCSDYKGSFWVEDFLASADVNKLLIPDDLIGKRIVFKKVTREAKDPKYNVTNLIIDRVMGSVGTQTNAPTTTTPEEVATETAAPVVSTNDPMSVALELAVGKTETQFRSAISLHKDFIGSPLLPLAKAGAITAALVKEGKLVEVKEGNKTVYRKA